MSVVRHATVWIPNWNRSLQTFWKGMSETGQSCSGRHGRWLDDGHRNGRGNSTGKKIALPDAKKLLRFLARDDSNAAWSDEYEQFMASNPQESEEANQVADAWLDRVGAGLYSIGRTLMARIHATTTGMGVTPETSVALSPPGELVALPLAAGDIGDGAALFERWPTSLVQCTALL